MAEANDSRDTSSMGLLEHAGLDCAGAVQLHAAPELPEREQRLEPIDEQGIGIRLRAANSGLPVADDGERWSVAGQQGKTALHKTQEGQWGRPLGGLPTTHIIKPGITAIGDQTFTDQALSEHLTLAAARLLGINAAETAYQEFDGVPAVVVRRYDRVWAGETCIRIHQEDMCQALGKGPEEKYEEHGGPGVSAIAALLDHMADTAEQSTRFRMSFAMMVMFNHFSGSPDAHAKNYSMLMLPDRSLSFAPMYDAASGFGYSYLDSGKPRFPRNAMRIGSHEHFAGITEKDWQRFAAELKLPYDIVRTERDRIAKHLPDAFRTLIDGNIPAAARTRLLRSPLLPRLNENCRITA